MHTNLENKSSMGKCSPSCLILSSLSWSKLKLSVTNTSKNLWKSATESLRQRETRDPMSHSTWLDRAIRHTRSGLKVHQLTWCPAALSKDVNLKRSMAWNSQEDQALIANLPMASSSIRRLKRAIKIISIKTTSIKQILTSNSSTIPNNLRGFKKRTKIIKICIKRIRVVETFPTSQPSWTITLSIAWSQTRQVSMLCLSAKWEAPQPNNSICPNSSIRAAPPKRWNSMQTRPKSRAKSERLFINLGRLRIAKRSRSSNSNSRLPLSSQGMAQLGVALARLGKLERYAANLASMSMWGIIAPVLWGRIRRPLLAFWIHLRKVKSVTRVSCQAQRWVTLGHRSAVSRVIIRVPRRLARSLRQTCKT